MRMTPITIRDKVRLISVGLAMPCFFLAGMAAVYCSQFKTATGEIEFHEVMERGEMVLRPSVSYVTPDGRRWGLSEALPVNFRNGKYKEGDKVTVAYHPRGKGSHIASFEMWRFPIITGGLGALLFSLGIFGLRISRGLEKPLSHTEPDIA
jgi:hypothetical protein